MADISITLELDTSNYKRGLEDAASHAKQRTAEMGQSFKDFGNAAEAAFMRMGASAKEGDVVLQKVKESTDKLSGSFQNLGKSFSDSIGKFQSLQSAIVGISLGSFIKDSVLMASTLVQNAQEFGVTTQAMLELNKAAEMTGISTKSLDTMMNKMMKSAQDAADGNGKLRAAFNDLGVSTDYMRSHSADEVFQKLVEALAAIPDPAKRSYEAMQLLGRGAAAKDILELAENLRKTNGTLGDQAAAAEEAARAMEKFRGFINDVQLSIVNMLTPLLKMSEGLGGAETAAKAIVATFGALVAIKLVAFLLETAKALLIVRDALLAVASAEVLATGGLAAIGQWIGKIAAGAALFYGIEKGTEGVEAGIDAVTKAMNANTEANDKNKASQSGNNANKVPLLADKDIDRTLGAQQALKNQYNQMVLNNVEALKRLQLEIDLTTQSDDVAKSQLAANQANTNYLKEIQRISAEIAKLRAEEASSRGAVNHSGEIAILEREFGLVKNQADAVQELNQKLVQAQNLRAINNLYEQQSVNVATKLKDIQTEMNALMLGRAGQGQAQGQQELDAAIKAQVDLQEKQLQRKLTQAEITAITMQESDLYDELIKKQEQLSNAKASKSLSDLSGKQTEEALKKIADLRAAYDDSTLGALAKQMTAVDKLGDAQKKAIEESIKENFGNEWLESATAVDAYRKAIENSTKAMAELKDMTVAMYQQSTTFSHGWETAMGKFKDEANDNSKLGSQLFQGMTDGVIKAIDGMVSHGKFSFKDLFASLLMDIMNAQLRQAMLGIMGMFGNQAAGQAALSGGGLFSGIGAMLSGFGANGGVSTSIMDAGVSSGSSLASGTMFASGGGTIGSGQMAIVGEAGPELVKGPANVTSNSALNNLTGGGTTVNHNYTIQAVDAKSVAQLFYENRMTVYGTVQQAQKELPFRSAQPQY